MGVAKNIDEGRTRYGLMRDVGHLQARDLGHVSAALYMRPGAAFRRRATSLVAQRDRGLARLVHSRQRTNKVGLFERLVSLPRITLALPEAKERRVHSHANRNLPQGAGKASAESRRIIWRMIAEPRRTATRYKRLI
jgi:hypothetical protein